MKRIRRRERHAGSRPAGSLISLCRYLMNPRASLGDRYGGTYLRFRRAAVCGGGACGFACATWAGGFAGVTCTGGFACVACAGSFAGVAWAGGFAGMTWADALASDALAMAMERAI